MKFFNALTIASIIAPAVSFPGFKAGKSCTDPAKRIEWRELDPADQKGYIDSVLCLKTKPSRMGLNSSLYDDFPHLHFKLNDWIHGGSPFLPWHRYFGVVYERALRDCGYKGPGTYWDWTQDAEAGLLSSPVMADKNGFGGNGDNKKTETTPTGTKLKCVTSGPFAKLRPEYLEDEPKNLIDGGHCMFRNMPEVDEPEAYKTMAAVFGPKGIEELETTGNWTYFARSLEGGPHGSIHASLGGEMNPTTSPNEPLFFLHHAQIDRIWWMWQQQNSSRLSEYTGDAWKYPTKDLEEVSLEDVLGMGGIDDDITVKDVMDIENGPLCYHY
ncbi:monophenol monooxygenase (tyrosinase) [Fusarium heterosporum]|uniref:Monophenol monooxygenase (Tyrosinase) n=1 Tax=Fusarium heterosporum TaxID=42747 RepID=A0A8H5WLG2_FUSHE|nr:monophenol monooxygenase (tyrosinase) [Fusarium heterosporum]